jgi:hypothetical protein
LPAIIGNQFAGASHVLEYLYDDPVMPERDDAMEMAVARVMRTWSAIKQMPESSLCETRSMLVDALSQLHEIGEDELVFVGLKLLHRSQAL